MVQEKRFTPRLDIQGQALVMACGEMRGTPCIIDNVSQGGVRFFAGRELPVDGCVELRVASPGDEDDIVLRAKILRVMPGKQQGMHDYACQLESVENA